MSGISALEPDGIEKTQGLLKAGKQSHTFLLARSHNHRNSRRLTAATAAAAGAERLPLRSGVVAGLASMLGMPVPLGFGQHEGAVFPAPCDLTHVAGGLEEVRGSSTV